MIGTMIEIGNTEIAEIIVIADTENHTPAQAVPQVGTSAEERGIVMTTEDTEIGTEIPDAPLTEKEIITQMLADMIEITHSDHPIKGNTLSST